MNIEKEKLVYMCEARNFSDKTTSNYLGILSRYESWLLKKKKEINKDSLMEYFSSLKRSGNATATRKLIACGLKFYFKDVINNSELANSLPTIRQESKLPVILSKEEVKRLLDAITNVRHRGYVLLLYTCGLRTNELINIKTRDFDFDRNNLLVHGKGKRDRFVPLSDGFIKYITDHKHYFMKGEYFCSRQKDRKRLHVRSIAAIITKATAKAGIIKRVYPHLLRHSFATHCIDSGIDIRYVQVMLGHANILCTAQYTHISTMPSDINNKNLEFLNAY